MSKSVFDRVRSSCAAVAESATHVRVHEDRVATYARTLSAGDVTIPPIDTDHHIVGDPEKTLAFFVTLAAVNFGSGYFPHLRKRPGLSGYYTIASSLAERFRSEGAFSAAELSEIDATECVRLFGQSDAPEPIRELMSLFARAWNDLGHALLEEFGGRFVSLARAAEQSAERLVDLLAAQPFFRDVERYRGREISFFKRGQLLASDLALALDERGLGRFDDLDRLTIFADNLVPQVLRIDGLLEYDPALAGAIDRGDLIPAGSEEEIEIRACAVHATERIRDAIAARGMRITSRQLDQLLWHRGQRPEIKRAGNRHRTRTVYY